MSSCPNCQNQIEIKEEHFGTLFRCSFCQSEFFIDFSGNPENSKPESSPLADPQPSGNSPFSFDQAEPLVRTDNLITSESYTTNNFENPGAPLSTENTSPAQDYFNEVNDFANQVSNHSGILNFDLIIDEIDLPEQKEFILEQLQDKRLGLDIEEVKAKLKYGKVEIHNFPAPKVIVLVQRLQGHSLKISWRENVSIQ